MGHSAAALAEGKALRTFYFDIDGTVLREDTVAVKSGLAAGGFERLVRAAGFDQVVCVGNMIAVVRQLEEMGLAELDRARVIFDYCDGAFSDFSWFRREVSFVEDPHRRVRHLALESDWWYADDLASYYFSLENKSDVLDRELGRRVYVPHANGDGQDLATWLEGVASKSER